MSDTHHQIDLLRRRWPDIEWTAAGDLVIHGRRRQGSSQDIITSRPCPPDKWTAAGFGWVRSGPTRVAAIEAWMMSHPITTDFLGVLSEARRVTQLELEVARLKSAITKECP